MRNILKTNSFDFKFLECIQVVSNIAEEVNIPFFLIGATARDIIFEFIHGIKAPRATMDIDIAINVESWDFFDLLKKKLLNNIHFSATDQLQKFKYKDIFLDVVPFGSIADNDKLIWRENNNTMSVIGFTEVYNSAKIIGMGSNHQIKVKIPTLEGLTLLKFLSWKDAFPNRSTDAEDISFILKSYERTLDIDFAFEQYPEIIKKENFDLTLAGISILGLKIKEICYPNTLDVLVNILEEEISEECNYDLLSQMGGDVDDSLLLLKKLYDSIR